jgi:Competence protein
LDAGDLALVALATGRPRAAVPGLAAVVGLLVLVDPELAGCAGFALSVLATGGLLLVTPGWRDALRRHRVPAGLAEAVAVPAAAQLACAPVIAGISGTVGLAAVPANLLAVPAVPPAALLSPVWPGRANRHIPSKDVASLLSECLPARRWFLGCRVAGKIRDRPVEQHRAELTAVDRLGYPRAGVPAQFGDVLQAHPVVGHNQALVERPSSEKRGHHQAGEPSGRGRELGTLEFPGHRRRSFLSPKHPKHQSHSPNWRH